MAALSTYVGSTELTELIPTELIGTYIDNYPYTAQAGMAVAWAEPGSGSIARRFPRWNALSSVPAGNKAESDVFTDVNIDTTESTITPGIVGFRIPISDEVVAAVAASGNGQAVPEGVLEEALAALDNRIDADVLSSSTSATNTTGAVTDNFTAAKFRAADTAYRALFPRAGAHAFVGHLDAFRDLRESIGSTTAPFTATNVDMEMFGNPGAGAYVGNYMGYRMFESGNVKAESTGWSNFMTAMGRQRSGLGIVMTEDVRTEVTRADDGASRRVTYFNMSSWYGVGLTNPARILEVLSRT